MLKKIFAISILSCISLASIHASTYDIDCVFHMRKDGSAFLELGGHYYECQYIEHSSECPCLSN